MIEIRHIVKIYPLGETEVKALDDVSFSIKDGEFVAIMGPSGSGKSTCMHILGCLDTPTFGVYFLDGKDVSKLSEDELATIRSEKIGFVFQQFNLLSRTTVFRNVVLPLVYTGMGKEERDTKARQALHDAALPEAWWEHHTNQLSGGQIQRVAIARALVNSPSLILADEPTGNLDTKTGNTVLHAFQKLHDAGHTIVLITHEADVAEHAERIIHIRDGKIQSDSASHKRRIAHIQE